MSHHYCCICQKKEEEPENKVIPCNGQGCRVVVHQGCYGIESVPSSGLWYCRKCESQERAARVRCELCPTKEGAYKRTDQGGWSHVVCALYIPEVTFGNLTSMEPIVTSRVPRDRLSKVCSLCEDRGMESNATFGACMSCKYKTCKAHFHVTCGQKNGLLCEEEDPKDPSRLMYSGYCPTHMKKKKERRPSELKQLNSLRDDRRSQQRSVSTDTISPVITSGALANTVNTEAKMSPSHTSLKKRARKRKLSSSSESSDVSGVSPNFSAPHDTSKIPLLSVPMATDQKCPTTVDELDVKESSTDVVLPSDVQEQMQPSDVRVSADISQREGEGEGGGGESTWSPKVERSSESSDSSSDDSSTSSSEASDDEDTENNSKQQQQQQQEEDIEAMDVTPAHSDSVVSPREVPFSPSGSSLASNLTREENDAVTTQTTKGEKLTTKGTSQLKTTPKSQKDPEGISKMSRGLSPRGGTRRGGRGRVSPSFRGRGGAVGRSRGGRTPKSTGSGPVHSGPRKRSRDQRSPNTLEELLKQQWEDTVAFLSNSGPKQATVAGLLAELVKLQNENRQMEQKILELTSQREFFQVTNSQLRKVLQDNNSSVVSNSESEAIASSVNGGMVEHRVVDEPRQPINLSSSILLQDQSSSDVPTNPELGSEARGNTPGISLGTSVASNGIWIPASSVPKTMEQNTDEYSSSMWTLSGWQQETYHPQANRSGQDEGMDDKSKSVN